MTSDSDNFDIAFSAKLRVYVDSQDLFRPTAAVVAAAQSSGLARAPQRFRVRWWSSIAIAVGVAALLGAGATYILSDPGAGDNASDAARVIVGGLRYNSSTSVDLINIERELSVHGQMESTNTPHWFLDRTVFSVDGIDPAALLVARSISEPGERGRFRLLWGPNQNAAFPAICRYLEPDVRAATCKRAP